MYDLDDIKDTYQDNMGGNQVDVYFGAHEDVQEWPTKAAENASLATLRVLTGDVVMKPGTRMFTLRATIDTVKLTDTRQGEHDGRSHMNTLDFFHPQTKAKLLGFAHRTNNGKMFFIIKNYEGQTRLFGNEACGAQVGDGTVDTGDTAASRKGGANNFFYYDHGPTPIYTGSIPLTEAEGSGSGSGS